jgi:hypothetical protein
MSRDIPASGAIEICRKNSDEGGGGGGGDTANKNYILLIKSFSTVVLMGGRLLEFSKHLWL